MSKYRKKGKQPAFLLYNDSKIFFDKLSDAEAGQLIKAIFAYKVNGELPDSLPPAADMAFCGIKNYLDRDAESYRETCAQNALNGSKGGKATQEKARQAKQATATPTQAKQADKDIIRETDIETDLQGIREKGVLPNSTPAAAINWASFCKLAAEAYKEAAQTFSLEECLAVFRYFFTGYQTHTGEAHPPLKKEQITAIMEKMPYTDDSEMHGAFDIDPESYEPLIDRYFQTPFDGCDYRINHFFSGDIRTNRFYEELY